MQTSTSTGAPLTPDQIRRRVNDYDGQVRQGLEDGTIRQVLKRFGESLVSRLFYFVATISNLIRRQVYLPIRKGPPSNKRRFHAACFCTTSFGRGTTLKPDVRPTSSIGNLRRSRSLIVATLSPPPCCCPSPCCPSPCCCSSPCRPSPCCCTFSCCCLSPSCPSCCCCCCCPGSP